MARPAKDKTFGIVNLENFHTLQGRAKKEALAVLREKGEPAVASTHYKASLSFDGMLDSIVIGNKRFVLPMSVSAPIDISTQPNRKNGLDAKATPETVKAAPAPDGEHTFVELPKGRFGRSRVLEVPTEVFRPLYRKLKIAGATHS